MTAVDKDVRELLRLIDERIALALPQTPPTPTRGVVAAIPDVRRALVRLDGGTQTVRVPIPLLPESLEVGDEVIVERGARGYGLITHILGRDPVSATGLDTVVIRARTDGGDDGPNINAVIQASTGPVRIVLPDPRYVVNTEILVNKDNVWLIGSGVSYDRPRRTEIATTTDIAGATIAFESVIAAGISGLSLNLYGTTGNGISVRSGVNDIVLEDFEVKLWSGICLELVYVSGPFNARIWADRFLLVAGTGTGISVQGLYHARFENFQATITSTGTGIDVLGSDDCFFEGYAVTAPEGGVCLRINGGDWGSADYSGSHMLGKGFFNGLSETKIVVEGDGMDVTGRRHLIMGISCEDWGGGHTIVADVGAMPSYLDSEGKHNFRTDLGTTALLRDDFMSSGAAGTFTPVLTFATPPTNPFTYTAQSGRYTKRGNLCSIRILIVTSAFNTAGAASYLKITGLPFTSSPYTGYAMMAASMKGYTKAGFTQVMAEIAANATDLYFYATGSGVAGTELVVGDMPTGGPVLIFVSGEYEV